jgi:hypothetical protein
VHRVDYREGAKGAGSPNIFVFAGPAGGPEFKVTCMGEGGKFFSGGRGGCQHPMHMHDCIAVALSWDTYTYYILRSSTYLNVSLNTCSS